MKKLLFLILILLVSVPAFGATTNQITYVTAYGNIVFNFNAQYTYGQFATGDYWVVGPLTITSITPTHADGEHGCEVNPSANSYSQGFDSELANYVESQNITFPYYANPATGIKSIVKVISSPYNETSGTRHIYAGRVLTVVASVPGDNGTTLFRPPYVGTTKPFYSIEDINQALIPSYTIVGPTRGSVGGAWTLAKITSFFGPTNIEHIPSGRYFRPIECNPDNLDNYGPQNTQYYGEAILSLMLNDSYSAKLPSLIKVLQHGIDKIYWHSAGNWDPNTGHNPGETIITSFTAALLNLTSYKALLGDSANVFDQEMGFTLPSSKYSNVVLWGLQIATESGYWNMIATGSGNQSQADPYGYIDGGRSGTAGGYYTIVGHGIKATVATWTLMPGIASFINATTLNEFTLYVNRVFTVGMRNSPDPCAPYPYAELSGNLTGRGVTWGEDPAHRSPPMCILDASVVGFNYSTPTTFTCASGQVCGRMASRYTGAPYQYSSAFVTAMWETYATGTPPPVDTTNPSITVIRPTTGPRWSQQSSTAGISGSASDNVGVTEVSWSSRVEEADGDISVYTGTCTGTTSWTCYPITLYEVSGVPTDNVITISARDAAGNSGTDSFTIVYPGTDIAHGHSIYIH